MAVILAVSRLGGLIGGPESANLLRKFGAGDGTRTRDLLITNQLLYQLSYAGQ